MSTEDSKSSYRQIVKTTSLFGGVQVIQILSTIIRGKIVAILLGAIGMGINTMLNSIVTLIVQLATVGLNFSAVRDISKANDTNDFYSLSRIITVFKRMMNYCAALGAIIIISFSFLISKITFGNYNYTFGLVVLSIVVVLNILNSSNITILQGTQRLKEMAKASLYGSVFGLIFSVPFYYFYGQKGIIPALITGAIIAFILSTFFARKVNIAKIEFGIKTVFKEGSEMAKLGFAMMISTLIGTAVNYLTNAYIGNVGSLSEVGLYGAGISITNQYVGVIFTAMSVDYFPRLSAVSNNKDKVNEVVNQQAEIVVLIIVPLLILMILTAPVLIRILLSKQFLVISNFVCWVAFALLFKAASFALGYISFAKGDRKTFFIFEGLIGSFLILSCNIIGYRIGGLTGIAISILISYIIYLIAVNVLVSKVYKFNLSMNFIKMFAFSVVLMAGTLSLRLLYPNFIGYVLGAMLLIVSIIYSFFELNKRIGIKTLFSKFKSKAT